MIGLLPETGLGPNGQLIAPPGLAKGLNFEVLHPGRDCGFFRDVQGIDIIPEEEWDPFIEAGVSLEGNSSNFLYNQGSVGSCGSEGICGVTETMLDVAEGVDYEPVLFNPYGTYGRVNGNRDQGSSLIANLRFAREFGSFPESVWPRSMGWRATPSAEAYAAAKNYRIHEFYEISNWIEYGSALLQRFGVYSGYSGHAWFSVRLMNRQQIKWRNSWGSSWGDNGYGILNASRIMWNYGVYAVRTIVVA